MSEVQKCKEALLEARACVAQALETKKQESPLIDESGIVGRLISLIRMIDAVLSMPGKGKRVFTP